MRQEVVLFHSALGLRPAVREFADRLRAAGHTVHTPDLFEGAVFDNLAEGIRHRDHIGIEALLARALAAVDGLPGDVVFAGFSMGTGAAEYLAATRHGARGAVLVHGAFDPAAFGIAEWPAVPVQVHYAAGDSEVDHVAVDALAKAVRRAGALIDVHVYESGGHLFEDASYEGADPASAALMTDRVLAFLESVGQVPVEAAAGI